MRTLDALITDSPVFRGLETEHLELIAGCASNVVFTEGERLFREGDKADVFFLVRHGLVALDAYVPNRGQITVETVGSGEIVGWSWLVPPYRWHFTGRAVEPVRAVQFDGACLRGKLNEDTRLGYELVGRFTQVLVNRLQATRLQLMDVYGDSDR
jgi:CRP/FNR family transcriptional regulator, cyclic AMP receptor protein